MTLSIPKYRQLTCQIATTDLSNRRLGLLNGVSHNTVGKLRECFLRCGLPWEELANLPDDAFSAKLGVISQVNSSSKTIPDWSLVHKELQGRDITLQLLHTEYLHSLGDTPEKALRYTQFCSRYRLWKKSQRISMRQTHKPGQKMFVDFCGASVVVANRSENTTTKAQIFVAVLGASNYTFAFAVPSQKIPDWLECHVKALEFFGGVPAQFVPDNLKSAVISNKRDSILINSSYADLAKHYDVIINPARPRKPKDKSKAEVGVQIVQRWVLAPLRKINFYSIDELNAEISRRIAILNEKSSKKRPESRRDIFLRLERDALRPIENGHYETGEWRYNTRVPETYHVEFDGSHYSVPHHYINHLVNLRATHRVIEILLNDFRIASHPRRRSPGNSTATEHMPQNHAEYQNDTSEKLLAWAESVGPDVFEWVSRQISEKQLFAAGVKSARELRRLSKAYDSFEQINSACAFANKFKILGIHRLKDILSKRLYEVPLRESTSWVKGHINVRGKEYFALAGEDAKHAE